MPYFCSYYFDLIIFIFLLTVPKYYASTMNVHEEKITKREEGERETIERRKQLWQTNHVYVYVQ